MLYDLVNLEHGLCKPISNHRKPIKTHDKQMDNPGPCGKPSIQMKPQEANIITGSPTTAFELSTYGFYLRF
jgi:hypothetical protein